MTGSHYQYDVVPAAFGLEISFQFVVSSFESFGPLTRNSEPETRNLVYSSMESIIPIQCSAFSSPRANSEITSKT